MSWAPLALHDRRLSAPVQERTCTCSRAHAKGCCIVSRVLAYVGVFTSRRLLAVALLGFASGLPLALTGSTLQAWMTVEGVDLSTMGLFALVGLPYTLKFLWSPLLDRFVPPFLGRRRGWIVITQLLLMLGIWLMAGARVQEAPLALAVLALAVALASASQDIVVDAYRTDILAPPERGAGAAVFVLGYRLGMLTAGALALIIAANWGWPSTYMLMGGLLLVGMAAAFFGPEPAQAEPPKDLRAAVVEPVRDLLASRAALAFLGLVVLYKLGDAFAGSLTTAFLLKGAGFSLAAVGAINKGWGLFATIAGAVFAGGLMARWSLYRALMVFGVLQACTNLLFMLLSWSGANRGLLFAVIGLENIAGGMGTAAFVALLMSLCKRRFSATQYALLSALAAVGRVFAGPPAGFLAETAGWPIFFLVSFGVALPGLFLLRRMRAAVDALQ
ncbi:MAG: MFS transporter [Deltaproteobacteria bacterium]|nr:MFS transporter [Deltaproteobacteria bacterium]